MGVAVLVSSLAGDVREVGASRAEEVGTPPQRPPALPPPTPPPVVNPVRRFQELWKLDAGGREAALTGKTEWQQRYLRERLAEFDTLAPTEREVRLRLMELRYYLLMLVRTPPDQRTERLKEVPAKDRDLLAERLQDWERLPANQQKELIENETMLSHLSWFETGSAEQREASLRAWSPQTRQEFEADLYRWRGLQQAERERMTRNFNRFFDLSNRQKQESTLDRVSEADRANVSVPWPRLNNCLDRPVQVPRGAQSVRWNDGGRTIPVSLQNAARWQSMSPEEKRVWRQVATHINATRSSNVRRVLLRRCRDPLTRILHNSTVSAPARSREDSGAPGFSGLC